MYINFIPNRWKLKSLFLVKISGVEVTVVAGMGVIPAEEDEDEVMCLLYSLVLIRY